jgi:hypothetical protein
MNAKTSLIATLLTAGYADRKTRDDRITDAELTPLIFRNHELAGAGYPFLASLAPKYRALQ